MKVKDIMTTNVATCTPDTPLREVAGMMVACDCGEIPVVDASGRPTGVVTDRDITCRTVAQGRNPLELRARDVMSTPAVTVSPDMSLDDCLRIMEENQIRRVPVVDALGGPCCGVVAQADIARHASKGDTAHVVKQVSKPTADSRSVSGH